MYPTTWTDQPSAVTEFPIILSVSSTSGDIVEIRAENPPLTVHGSRAYLTVGSLFGSQTLRCVSLLAAVLAANVVLHARRNSRDLTPPEGTVLLPNETRPTAYDVRA